MQACKSDLTLKTAKFATQPLRIGNAKNTARDLQSEKHEWTGSCFLGIREGEEGGALKIRNYATVY